MWDRITDGALGAVVLVDTSRIGDSYAPIDYFEARDIPFIVAVNQFADAPEGTEDEIREVLALSPGIPILTVDARVRESVKTTVLTLVDHLLSLVNETRCTLAKWPTST